jgi:hypothetical protein
MGKGNIIGPSNNPTISTAKGIWNLNSQRIAQAANNWPFGTRAEYLTTVSSTTDATSYTFNNIYLGTPTPGRIIFFHVPAEWIPNPSGNLNFSSTWTTSNGVSNNSLVVSDGGLGEAGQNYPILSSYAVYTGRYFSMSSSNIPTANSGNLFFRVTLNNVLCAGVAPSIFALHNLTSATPTVVESGIGSQVLTNFTPGSIAIVFQTVYDAEAVPTITGSPLALTFINNNTRTVQSATMKTVIYLVQNNTSDTVTETITSTSSTVNLRYYRFR